MMTSLWMNTVTMACLKSLRSEVFSVVFSSRPHRKNGCFSSLSKQLITTHIRGRIKIKKVSVGKRSGLLFASNNIDLFQV